jgi:hypothetical protein
MLFLWLHMIMAFKKTTAIRVFLSLLFWGQLVISTIEGQTQEVLHSSLQGDTLLQQLVLDYKPVTVMSYREAREAMYTEIDNKDGILAGVYSGFEISLDTNSVSPVSEAFDLGINCEHSYPQSKGAGQVPAKSNIHHLFPSKIEVNADRGSCPFNEIDDNLTKLWYKNSSVLNNIPAMDIDDYSEKDIAGSVCGSFEPREDKKGDIARAQFYFYTMYKAQADSADPDFFHMQKEILLEWNYLDPVDELEYERTFAIAKYQDNLPNPFVLDSTLARRAYFLPDVVLGIADVEQQTPIKIFPNPSYDKILYLENNHDADVIIRVSNLLGEYQKQFELGQNLRRYSIPIARWPKGIYIFQLFDSSSHSHLGNIRFLKI